MTQNDIEDMLDNLRRIKSRGDLDSIKIKRLEIELRFLSTFLKYRHLVSPDSFVKISKKAKLIDEMLQSVFDGNPDECKTNLNVERLVSHLLEFIKGNTSLRYNFELNYSHLSEYMDCLDKNLNDVPMFLELDTTDWILELDIEWTNKKRILEQVKIIPKKMRFLKQVKIIQKKMMKPHIVILEKEFSYLTSVFTDVAKVQLEHEILKDFQRCTINLAYEAEVAIDSILAHCNALWYLFCSLPTIIKEIKHISAEVTRMWSENLAFKPFSKVEPSKYPATQHSNHMNDEEIVG